MEKNNLIAKEELKKAFENHQKGKFDSAKSIYIKVLKIEPNQFDANFLLGSLLGQTNKFEESIKYFKKAIEIKPDYALVYNNLGSSLKELGNYEESIDAYKKAIKLQPKNFEAYNNLGTLFKELDEYKKAIECFQKAIEIKSDFAKAHHNLAVIFKEQGELEKANLFFKNAVKYNPENLAAYYQLKYIDKEILDLDFKKKIIKIINNQKCTERNIAFGNFLLSIYEKRSKNYKKEFQYLIKGHQHFYKSKLKKFINPVSFWLSELPEVSNKIKLTNTTVVVDREIKPIFIIGTPRCGSTLIEKIIASGKNLIPAGEETGILTSYIKKNIEKNYFNVDRESIVEYFINRCKSKNLLKNEKSVFTDKSLENFFYINMIRKIFKYGKIINCKRNPLSAIISILQNNLVELSWAHNLNDIFKYFDIYYKILNEFKKNFPDSIYEVQLENFVADPIVESKKLMKFCDLPWDESCLQFYKRKDLISKTTSGIQIRQEIFKYPREKDLPYMEFLKEYKNKYYWFN